MSFRVGQSSVNKIIRETCNAIWKDLKAKVLAPPGRSQFAEVARGFEEKWNCPYVLGSIDGNHVHNIMAPPKKGSAFFNYKYFHSTILHDVCDYRYQKRTR